MPDSRKLLIVSLSRSGGKLLRTLFDGHSCIKVYPFEYWNTRAKNAFHERYHREFESFSPDVKLDVCGFYSRATRQIESRFSKEHAIEFTQDLQKGAASARTFAEMYDLFSSLFFDMAGENKNKPMVLNHCGSLCTISKEKIDKIYGRNTKIISIRDPRATFASMEARRARKFTGIKGSRLKKNELLKHEQRNLDDGREGSYLYEFCLNYKFMVANYFLNREKVVFTKFEDLVVDPEKTMRRLAGELEIPFEPCLLQPTENGVSRSANTSFARQSHTVDPAAARGWEDHLTDRLQKHIVDSLASEMEMLGYL